MASYEIIHLIEPIEFGGNMVYEVEAEFLRRKNNCVYVKSLRDKTTRTSKMYIPYENISWIEVTNS